MKRSLIFLLVAVLSMSMAAQNKPTKEERKAAEKQQMEQLTAHYVQVFGLQDEKAEKFGKIFADYNKKLQEVNKLYKSPKVNKEQPLTEEQEEAQILARFERQRAIINMREFYYKKLRTVLEPSQIKRIYEDEKTRKAQMNPMKKGNKQRK